jgi:hypothetical protein
MDDPETTHRTRLSRGTRGRVLFLVATTIFASLVGFGFSRIGGDADSPSTVKVRAVSDVRNVTVTTSSQSASVGYDGPANCAPTTDAATSGGSPQELMRSASEVAKGTIEGKAWSLWSSHGESGATGLEDGGLVFGGREYGLCPGYPNPSETEMIDTGGDAIIYGVVDYPGLAKVQIATGSLNSFATGAALPSPHVSVVNGVSFYIGTLPRPACAYSYFEINTTSPSYSAEHNIGFGENGANQGYSITNNEGNVGACVSGKLDPLSYSEGIWQLPPGQFQSSFGSSAASSSGSGSGRVDSGERSERHLNLLSDNGSFLIGCAVERHHVDGRRSCPRDCARTALEPLVRQGPVGSGRNRGRRSRPRWSRLWPVPGLPQSGRAGVDRRRPDGIVAGIVGYPGLATVDLSESTAGTFDVGQTLPSPSVQVVDGVSFFIGILPKSACDYSSLELNTTSPGVSAEHNVGFGTCAPNELVPISESQGIWQLPPGQFQSNF